MTIEAHDGARRRLLGAGAALGLTGLFPSVARAKTGERRLRFYNTHTGERANPVYWADGRYLPDGLAEANRILRDHRTGDVKAIDPALFDLLTQLRDLSGSDRREFHIISGYRSPKTNAMLHDRSSAVATRSLHQVGKAVDIRVPGVDLGRLRSMALSMKRGGVGYYPDQDFVHVDTGRVRFW